MVITKLGDPSPCGTHPDLHCTRYAEKEGVLDKAYELRDRLAKDFRVKVDDSDKTPGFKFAEAEMRGYPIRVEIGPRISRQASA